MTTFQPITPNWLTAAWDQFVADDPELELAYNYPDYPSEQTGEGDWIDLFLDNTNRFPIGRLWLNADTENIGLIPLPQGNISYQTLIALQLREYNYNGVSALIAYDQIRTQFYADNWHTGELSDANIQTMSPDEANV